MKKKRGCFCKMCQFYSPAADEIIKVLPPLLRERFRDIMDEWMQVGEDASYYRAILDGSWPTSIAHLEAALEKARAMTSKEKKA